MSLMSAPFPPSPPQSTVSSPVSGHTAPYSLTDSELRTFRRILCSSPDATIAFAYYPRNPVHPHFIVSERLTDQNLRFARLDEFDDVFQHGDLLASWLRYARTIASFNLYPESHRDLQINRLLWRTAQRGEYSPADGNMLLENNVLSVSMPATFYSFLADVSEEQLNLCMLEILTLIAEEEDEEGFDLMQSELDHTVWKNLVQYISQQSQRHNRLEQVTAGGVKLSTYVEMLLKLCYHSPWKIDIYTGYVTPRGMMSALLAASAATKHSLNHRRLLHHGYDRELVRSGAKRPISSSTLQTSPPSRIPSSFANRNSVFWKLFQDWRRYRWMLVHLLGLHPREATAAMLHSISEGTQEKAWEQVDAVAHVFLDAFRTLPQDAFLSSLPEDVVSTKIAPFVLLNESKG